MNDVNNGNKKDVIVTHEERREADRIALRQEMEFILYLDAFKGTMIDLSETGIRFDTEDSIIIRLKTKVGVEEFTKDAKLVWAKKKEGGGMSYGFEFVPDVD